MHCNVAYIFNPELTVNELLKTVCDEFGVPVGHQVPGPASVKDYIDPLNEFLLKAHAAKQNSVLIIDEAQNLSADVLEQLRLLTNLETNERKLLQIILIGQPGLRRMLARPELEQLAQRVIARFHLEVLSEPETEQYMRHRLGVAGLNGDLPFDHRATRRVYQLSGGVPRRINLLCDRAMLGAFAKGMTTIDSQIVDKAASEVFEQEVYGAPQPARSNKLVGALGLATGAALVSVALWAMSGGAYRQSPTVGRVIDMTVATPEAQPVAVAEPALRLTASLAVPAAALDPASASDLTPEMQPATPLLQPER